MLRDLPIRRVFRHFPVVSKHPRARVLAPRRRGRGPARALLGDARRADGRPGATWTTPTCGSAASALGIDLDRFEADRRSEAVAERVQRDFRSGIRAGVASTPTLFVDGEAHPGVPGAASAGPPARAIGTAG